MAFLKVVSGNCPGQILELNGERMVIGRHPNCEIVLDSASVSRHHARILESHGNYYLEDLRSRNGTQLNDQDLQGRTELRETDQIRICDILFTFHREMPASEDEEAQQLDSTMVGKYVLPDSKPSSAEAASVIDDAEVTDSQDSPADRSSIISTLDAGSSSNLRLGTKPEAKLRAVLEISKALRQTLRLDDVLEKILTGLFKIFPQGEEALVLLRKASGDKLTVKASQTHRTTKTQTPVRPSMTIVRQALETGDGILSADALQDTRFKASESLSDLRIRSIMCVPLLGSNGESLGVLQIDTKDAARQFSEEDLDVLVSVASQSGLAIENATLHEQVLSEQELHRDLEVATQIQLGFLPNQSPKVTGYDFADYYESAQDVGGDYFDYITLPDGRVAVALGDVAGKGVPAALLMARLYSSARYHLLTQPSPAAALAGLNAEIASSGLGHRFITSILVVLNPATHQMAVVNAGHLPPVFRNAKGQAWTMDVSRSGVPLGILPDQQFVEEDVSLQPGETCVLYTDGITEAMNPQNDIYGRDRLTEYVAGGPESIEELIKGIVADVESYCGRRAQRDDMCLVGLKRAEAS